jgi:hypothetical protein
MQYLCGGGFHPCSLTGSKHHRDYRTCHRFGSIKSRIAPLHGGAVLVAKMRQVPANTGEPETSVPLRIAERGPASKIGGGLQHFGNHNDGMVNGIQELTSQP